MPGILFRWLFTTLAILMIPYLVSGVEVKGFGSALAAAAVLGVLNALVRPVVIFMALAWSIIAFRLYFPIAMAVIILVVNALLFELAGFFISGLHVESFSAALIAALIVSLVSWVANFAVAGGISEKTTVVTTAGGRDTIDMRRGSGGRWE